MKKQVVDNKLPIIEARVPIKLIPPDIPLGSLFKVKISRVTPLVKIPISDP